MQTVRNKQNQLIEFNEMHVRGSVYKDELVLRLDGIRLWLELYSVEKGDE